MVVMDHVRCGWQIRKMDDNKSVNAAILERLEGRTIFTRELRKDGRTSCGS